jgi:hypothetical protein
MAFVFNTEHLCSVVRSHPVGLKTREKLALSIRCPTCGAKPGEKCERHRLIHCNPAWDDFAESNGAPQHERNGDVTPTAVWGYQPGNDRFGTRKHTVTWLVKLFGTIFRCRCQRIRRRGLRATTEQLQSLSVRDERDFSPSSSF